MSKPIVLTGDSVINSYGFRVMTAGGELTDYLKNPVLLYDHTRRHGENDRDIILPIGKMTDLRSDGSRIIGTPEFDLEDKFAAEVSRKYDKDIMNMASIGFEAMEWSTEPELMLPGQTLPTVTKWKLKEVSITDIGANPNACKLSHQGFTLTLNAATRREDIEAFFKTQQPTNPQMKKVIAALNNSKLVNLSEASGEELVAEAVTTLSAQLSAKDQTIAAKDAEINRLKTEAQAAKENALKERATSLVESALSAKKIVAAQKDNFINLASQSEEGYKSVKQLLDSLQGYQPVVPQLSGGPVELPTSKAELVKLHDKYAKGEASWKELSEDQIKQIWKAKHGKEIHSSTLNALLGK